MGTYYIDFVDTFCPPVPAYYTTAHSTASPAENGNTCSAAEAAPPIQLCGDPINPASGNTYNSAQDFSGSNAALLTFGRYYNSTDVTQGGFGSAWRGSYSRSIKANARIASYQPLTNAGAAYSSLYDDEASACTSGFTQIRPQVPTWSGAIASFSNGVCNLSKAGVPIGTLAIYSAYDYNIAPEASPPSFDYIDDEGHTVRFSVIGGVITAPPGYGLKLSQTPSGYTLTDGSDNIETYGSSGKLLSITSRAGVVQTMNYDGSDRLSAVVDSFGHQLTLSYDSQNRLIEITRQ